MCWRSARSRIEMELTMNKDELSVVLMAAGSGSRFRAAIPKQFVKLQGKELVAWSLIRIEEQLPFKELVIACAPQMRSRITKICRKRTPALLSLLKFADGGETRQQSVINALKSCSGKSILLHEAARPCASRALFERILNHPAPNVTSAEDIPFTVLKRKGSGNESRICGILQRDELFNVQLPQKFELKPLLQAHLNAESEGITFTDDSSLLFHYGTQVAAATGEAGNIKVTHPGDLKVAGHILKRLRDQTEST